MIYDKNKGIIYIGGFELPDKNAAAHRVLSNGKLLNLLGYNVSFIGAKKNFNSGIPEELTLKSGKFKVWHLNYPSTVIEWLKYLTGISNILKIVTKRYPDHPEAIIAYDYPAIALLRLWKYCRKNNIRLIGDCTEWYIASGSLFFRIIKNFDTALRMRLIHKKLDGLIVISSYLFSYYKPYVKNLLLLPPLIDKEDSNFSISQNTSNVRTLVYAGSPVYGKNGIKDRIDKLLLALSQIKKQFDIAVRFLIIGISRDEFVETFGENSIPGNIDESIEFRGKVLHNEVLQLINKADYSIFLRDKNRVTMAGFPTKFVESIRCGTPVLTNESSNITDYIINGELGFLLDVSSLQTLADSIFRAISQPQDKIIAMKKSCLASDLFDFRSYTNNFEVFLNKMKMC